MFKYFEKKFSPRLAEDVKTAFEKLLSSECKHKFLEGMILTDSDTPLIEKLACTNKDCKLEIKLREHVVHGSHFGLKLQFYYLSEAIEEVEKKLVTFKRCAEVTHHNQQP